MVIVKRMVWLLAALLAIGIAQAQQDDLNPLTGSPFDSEFTARRPLIVKISNAPALVRPQAGIGAADWVFEHYTEAGVTRFSAVFYGAAPTRVGSVRSARLIDTQLVPMFDGLLASAGASIGVDKTIYGADAIIEALCRQRTDRQQCYREAASIEPSGDVPPSSFAGRAYQAVSVGSPIYRRDPRLPVPHNLFVDVRALWDLAAQDGHAGPPALGNLRFDIRPADDAAGQANRLDVRYRTTLASWQYDAENGHYLRYTDGQPHADALTDAQIAAENVIVLYADHQETTIVESEFQGAVYYSQHIDLSSGGDALMLRDGQAYPVQWQRPTAGGMLQFTLDSQPFALKPGKTFVQVMPLREQRDSALEYVLIIA